MSNKLIKEFKEYFIIAFIPYFKVEKIRFQIKITHIPDLDIEKLSDASGYQKINCKFESKEAAFNFIMLGKWDLSSYENSGAMEDVLNGFKTNYTKISQRNLIPGKHLKLTIEQQGKKPYHTLVLISKVCHEGIWVFDSDSCSGYSTIVSVFRGLTEGIYVYVKNGFNYHYTVSSNILIMEDCEGNPIKIDNFLED